MNICVYCSSSNAVAPAYFDAARTLGQRIAHRGDTLVYGGADVGLMGALAQAVKIGGGTVIGVMPTVLQEKRIVFTDADELVTTRDMRERKAVMESRADAFVALPGGFGTLEELSEILTLRQIGVHTKPIVLLNTEGYYAPLIALFEHFYQQQFAHPWRDMYYLAHEVDDVFRYLESYAPAPAPRKWDGPGEKS
ncbi:MAG: TIGR00730 family Rossman fold protein [Anaerolineae bacterium]|nr:TIGR00730 family Rossman fold protein [Anaerolineae bacterium]